MLKIFYTIYMTTFMSFATLLSFGLWGSVARGTHVTFDDQPSSTRLPEEALISLDFGVQAVTVPCGENNENFDMLAYLQNFEEAGVTMVYDIKKSDTSAADDNAEVYVWMVSVEQVFAALEPGPVELRELLGKPAFILSDPMNMESMEVTKEVQKNSLEAFLSGLPQEVRVYKRADDDRLALVHGPAEEPRATNS